MIIDPYAYCLQGPYQGGVRTLKCPGAKKKKIFYFKLSDDGAIGYCTELHHKGCRSSHNHFDSKMACEQSCAVPINHRNTHG